MASGDCFIGRLGYFMIVRRYCWPMSASSGGDKGIHPDAALITVNEEPGVMLPGHCFTIEVSHQALLVNSLRCRSNQIFLALPSTRA